MKKILIATTALVATAGVAAADVKLSGYGRFGLDYRGDRGISGVVQGAPGGVLTDNKTQVNMRMRVNIDASTETDSGVTFGGRIRIQSQTPNGAGGSPRAGLNAAMLYATYGGLRMEVGNTKGALDEADLAFNSEMGYLNRSFGNPAGNFFGYSSTGYGGDRMGVYASYAFGDGNVRFSWIDLDQASDLPVTRDEEIALSGDYRWGQFTLSAGYADNAGGWANEKNYFIGGEYAINSDANVGLLWFRQDVDLVGDSDRITLYGNYTQGAITYRGYVSRDDNYGRNLQPGVGGGVHTALAPIGSADATKTAFGVGLDYDLGGARLGLDLQRSYTKDTVAGVGVRFDF